MEERDEEWREGGKVWKKGEGGEVCLNTRILLGEWKEEGGGGEGVSVYCLLLGEGIFGGGGYFFCYFILSCFNKQRSRR